MTQRPTIRTAIRRLARAATIGALAAAVSLGAPAQPVAGGAGAFGDAMEAYEVGHYALAYERFAQLADAGHAQAARIAVQMRRYGPQLYRAQFPATPPQVERWVRVAECDAVVRDGGCRVEARAR